MSAKLKGNAVVAQSGGPTGVINQSLVGVIEEVCQHDCVEQLLGAVHAVEGIVKEEFVNLKGLSKRQLEDVARTPAAALGSSRVKPDREYCSRIFEAFRNHNVRYFFYIGGNDSANTVHIINQLAQEAAYEMKVFHVPKTIDNDLLVTDHCPGYGTAATFVAHALIGDDCDNRALRGTKIDVIMGRNAGFLTAASMLARRRPDDGPHLIYVPERPVGREQLADDIAAVNDSLGRCVVAVSEGIRDLDGVCWAEKIGENIELDAHGNKQLSGTGALADFIAGVVREKMPGTRVRGDTFGYLQRSFPGLVSRVDAYEARYCGRMAVFYAVGAAHTGSVALQRFGRGDRYRAETFVTTLASVAGGAKELPQHFINEAGNNITDDFYDYVSPLVEPLPIIGHLR